MWTPTPVFFAIVLLEVTSPASAEMPLQDVLLPFLDKLYVQKSQRQVHEEAVTPDLSVPGFNS